MILSEAIISGTLRQYGFRCGTRVAHMCFYPHVRKGYVGQSIGSIGWLSPIQQLLESGDSELYHTSLRQLVVVSSTQLIYGNMHLGTTVLIATGIM
jgi:hypothetical protein